MPNQNNKAWEGFQSGHNACAGCGAAIAMRHITKVVDECVGKNAIYTIATGCMEVISTAYPLTAWNVPMIHSAFENAAATASGISASLKMQGKGNESIVVAIAGDGGTFDIGLQALSGMLERKHKVLFICYDNESYQNTGRQRSSATPLHAETSTTPMGLKIHGKVEEKKNMPFIVASHGNVYVATASIGYLEDFKGKIRKAIKFMQENDAPAYIQVLCPCVPGWKMASNITMELAKKAVGCRVYPLFEIEKGKLSLNDIASSSLKDYLSLQGRFSGLNEKDIAEIEKHINENYKKLEDISKCKHGIF
ncbi:MAG: thiamine pyrophosphate-dependent enzyme [Candidatus Pacearchaeota archaeon]|nr:thiamine pyrophosphate-dependent enzyme [Candidatus Pacearchaeota archaeon]